MTPPTVNAYYNPLNNEIVFPAGILQPPFFSRAFPAAMNYGGIGMVMGHELTHGFDDQGRKFDAQGKLTEWWEPSVSTKFDERAACIEKQYGGFEVQPDLAERSSPWERTSPTTAASESLQRLKAYEGSTPVGNAGRRRLMNDHLCRGVAQTRCCSPETSGPDRRSAPAPEVPVNGPLSTATSSQRRSNAPRERRCIPRTRARSGSKRLHLTHNGEP
jgi:endothelin-converting enzyme/putative endopeptidase